MPRVPVTFNLEEEESLRELEEQKGMKDGILHKARWIKLTYRRALGQCYAHLALSVSMPGEANIIIRDGMYICGIKAYPRKTQDQTETVHEVQEVGSLHSRMPQREGHLWKLWGGPSHQGIP